MSAATRWLLVVIVSAAAAAGAADVASGTALTTVPLLWFLAVCPGMPYARLVAPPVDDDPVRRWIMAVGLSIALAAVVAETLLYAGAFTAFTTIAVLGGIAVVGAVIGLVVERTRARRAAEPSLAATTSE